MNRDPVGEIGGLNLYLFVDNNSLSSYDLLGLWLGGTHKYLTIVSLHDIKKLPEGFYERDRNNFSFLNKIEVVLQNANVSVDSGESADIMAWHFNRKLDESSLEGKQNYKELLEEQRNEFVAFLSDASPANCLESLKTLGMLSHAWQDYYAHAVKKDANTKKRYSRIEPGKIKGDPDNNIGLEIKPSSFGWFPSYNRLGNLGEHGLGEPGSRAPDKNERLDQAKKFVTKKFDKYLNEWWEACECFKYEITFK